MASETQPRRKLVFDCLTLGGCEGKDVRLMDTEAGIFCGNCGGEAGARGEPTDLDLFRLAAAKEAEKHGV